MGFILLLDGRLLLGSALGDLLAFVEERGEEVDVALVEGFLAICKRNIACLLVRVYRS